MFIILTSPSLSQLKSLNLSRTKIDPKDFRALHTTILTSLTQLNLSHSKTATSTIAKALASWPGLTNLELLDITSFNKQAQKILRSSEYLQKVQIKGLTEFPDMGNWRNIGKYYSEEIFQTIKIVGQRKEVIQKVEEQMCTWAQKYKILLNFQSEKPVIKIDIKDLNSSIFLNKEKDSLRELKITNEEYATTLLEEAKRRLADQHQKHMANVYESNLSKK